MDEQKPSTNGINPNFRMRIVVPEGEDIVTLLRRGIAMELDGASSDKAAETVGIGKSSYVSGRKIVLLVDNKDLTETDAAVAKEALAIFQKTLQLSPAMEMIEALAKRVWGDPKNIYNLPSYAAKRHEQFDRTFGILMQACMTTDEIDLPYLSLKKANEVARQIGKARGALERFAVRIKDFHK